MKGRHAGVWCTACGAEDSSFWRRHPITKEYLCNRCGLAAYESARHNTNRAPSTPPRASKKRSRATSTSSFSPSPKRPARSASTGADIVPGLGRTRAQRARAATLGLFDQGGNSSSDAEEREAEEHTAFTAPSPVRPQVDPKPPKEDATPLRCISCDHPLAARSDGLLLRGRPAVCDDCAGADGSDDERAVAPRLVQREEEDEGGEDKNEDDQWKGSDAGLMGLMLGCRWGKREEWSGPQLSYDLERTRTAASVLDRTLEDELRLFQGLSPLLSTPHPYYTFCPSPSLSRPGTPGPFRPTTPSPTPTLARTLAISKLPALTPRSTVPFPSPFGWHTSPSPQRAGTWPRRNEHLWWMTCDGF